MASANDLINAVAKKTGVAAGDVKKILDQLGVDALSREVKSAGFTKEIRADDLKLAARIGKSSVAV